MIKAMGNGMDPARRDPKDPWDSVGFSWAAGPLASMLIRHSQSADPMNSSLRHDPGSRRQPSTVAAVAFCILASLSFTSQANAQTASGLVSAWGKTCKMRVVEQFDVPMSDALVNMGATEKQGLDEGTTSLADIKNNGMSYNWEIRGKKVSGYCNVNGKGQITEFKQGL
jgi:hypothetical protein